MPIINQVNHFFFIIAAFFAILTAFRMFSYRTPMSIWAGCFLLSLTVDLSSYATQLVIEPNSPIFSFFFLVQVLSLAIGWIFWFLFILSNSGSSNGKVLKIILYVFCVITIILGFLALNNQSLVISSANIGLIGLITEPPHFSTAANSFLAFYFSGISIISSIFVLNLFRISDRPSRKIILQMVVGTLIMMILTLLEVVGFHPTGFLNLTQIGLALFSFFYYIDTFVWQFGGKLPISRETFFDGTNDGVLVLDYDNVILDMNAPAEKILQINKKDAVNKKLSKIWQSGAQIIANHPLDEFIEVESAFRLNGEDFTYDTSIKRMTGLNDAPIGRLVVFRNITERDRMERIIQDRSQDLQRANAMLAALAVANSNIQTATNPQNFFEILRKTLKDELPPVG